MIPFAESFAGVEDAYHRERVSAYFAGTTTRRRERHARKNHRVLARPARRADAPVS